MTAAPASSRIAFFGGSFDPPHLGHLAIARVARDAFHLDTVLFAPVGTQPLKPEGSSASFEDRLAMTRLAIEDEPRFAISLVDAPKSPAAGSARPNYTPNYTPNFTIDTLKALRAEFQPDCTLYCLMGADSFFGLKQWHRPADIPFAAALIVASRPVASRPGQPLDGLQAALPPGLTLEPAPLGDRIESGIDVRAFTLLSSAGQRTPFYVLPGLDVEISASQIRESIREEIRKTVPRRSSIEMPSTALAPPAPPALARIETMLPAAVAEYIRRHGLYR